jgi:hypothetical protein
MIVLSVLLWFTDSDYSFSIFTLLTIVLSVLLWFTTSDYPFSIFTLLAIVLSDRQYNGQKCEDTKGVIRRRKSKDRQYNGQKCEDTKGVIRSRKSKKDRQYNGQKCEDTSSHFWPLYCLSFDLRILITPLISSHFWPLYCLSFFDLCLMVKSVKILKG